MCIWDALKENANQMKQLWNDIRRCSNQTLAWSYDMEGRAQKCVERYCEFANKKVEQLYKVSHPCLVDHQFKKEELESVGELSEVCSQIAWKCLYEARIGRPDILWSVNKLARSVRKWTQACDKRLARLISYIHHTNDYRQYCHVGNTAHHCRLRLFQDPDFAWDLEDSKSTSAGVLCILEAEHLFQSVGCARNKVLSRTAPQCLRSFLWMMGYVWMGHLLSIFGTLWLKCYVQPTTVWNPTIMSLRNSCEAQFQSQDTTCQKKTKGWTVEWSGLCSHKHTFFSRRISVVYLWRQRSQDQDDN